MKSIKVKKIVVIGKIPPPIGGVTIHIKRLLDHLENNNLDFDFVQLNFASLFKWFINSFWKNEIIHIHSSSPYARFLFSFIFFFSRHKTTLTYHADFDRFKGFKKILDILAIYFSHAPILINRNSYNKAKKINKNTRFISAFLPELNAETLEPKTRESILEKKLKYKTTFCLNASQIGIDKFGDEIYCGSKLVELFCRSNNQDKFLVFSDPSGQYSRLFSEKKLTENILLISHSHSFMEVLKLSDVFLRYTTTDGDALSIHEALFLGKPVIASDVVDRPNGVHLVHLREDRLQALLDKGTALSVAPLPDAHPFRHLLEVYRTLSL